MMGYEDETHVWMLARSRFRKIHWEDTRTGQLIWYLINRKRDLDEEVQGPFTVIDPSMGRIRNGQGVELNALKWKITLLIRDERPGDA